MNTKQTLTAAAAAGSLSLLLVAGCAQTLQPAPSPDPSATSTPAPTAPPETATPEQPAALVIPECDDLIPLAEVQQTVDVDWVRFDDAAEHVSRLHSKLGPATISAMERTTQHRYCFWGQPNSDGMSDVYLAELPDDARETLLAELRDSDFVESEHEGATVFTYRPAAIGTADVWQAFDGGTWVVASGAALGPRALEGLRAANG